MRYTFGRLLEFLSGRIKSLRHDYLDAKYRKNLKYTGIGTRFNGVSYLSGMDSIEIGNNVHIGDNAFIRGEGGLCIGDNTHISRNLLLYTMNHDYEGELLPYDSNMRYRPVTIGKNVWVGMNVTILPGAVIGNGAIIGAGAVVAGNVEEAGIYGACLAKKIKSRNLDHYKSLEETGKYGGVNGFPVS